MKRKDEKILQRFCTKCGSPKFKNWDELTSDEKFLIERTSSGKSSIEERKHHRFCARCFNEDGGVEKRA